MATDINQYKNAPVYSAPKEKPEGSTFRGDAPISYNNKPTGDTVKEEHPINSGK